jgi:hypothetical protein
MADHPKITEGADGRRYVVGPDGSEWPMFHAPDVQAEAAQDEPFDLPAYRYSEELPPSWRVTIELRRAEGRPVIAGLFVTAAHGDKVHHSGVTGRLLRTIRPEQLYRRAIAEIADADSPSATRFRAALAGLALDQRGKLPAPPGRTGPRGYAPIHYARWAEWYVQAAAEGKSNPPRWLAEQHGETESYVRATLKRAVDRGLLVMRGHGRPGGELTDLALTILREEEANHAD